MYGRDNRPIYERLMSEYRNRIVSGAIKPGERLPSVRELSVSMAINMNTIQRAYRELETEGYIYSVPGKGSFAAERNNIDEGRKKQLMDILSETAKELRYLGVSEDAIVRALGKGREK